MRTLVLSLLSLWLALPAHAQQDSSAPIPPMPPGPPIQTRAADHSQWTVTLVQMLSASDASTSPVPATGKEKKVFFGSQYTTAKTGKIIRRVTLDDQSRPWETWCVGDVQITVYPDGKTLAQPRPTDVGYFNPYYFDYAQTDFPELWWVSAKNYAGIKKQAGKPCLYFKDHVKLYADDEKASDLEAYVDVATRLPVLMIANTSSKTYAFGPAPNDLALPDTVQAVLRQRAKSASIATRTMPVLAP